MTEPLDSEGIEALRRIDTPTICNLLEMVAPDRRGHGYTTTHLHCTFPDLRPIVGYARTVTVRAKEAGPLDAEAYLELRCQYADYVGSGPAPRVSVIQDLDDPPGHGAFWGEVNSNVHKALGCLGVVTNGSVRDLDMIAPDFQLLAGMIGPSHAFVHIVDFGVEVNVHGMVVQSGDLVHADRHGAVVCSPSRGRRRGAGARFDAAARGGRHRDRARSRLHRREAQGGLQALGRDQVLRPARPADRSSGTEPAGREEQGRGERRNRDGPDDHVRRLRASERIPRSAKKTAVAVVVQGDLARPSRIVKRTPAAGAVGS